MSPRVSVYPIGEFGDAVAFHLKTLYPSVEVIDDISRLVPDENNWIVMAANVPIHVDAKPLSTQCIAANSSFIPISGFGPTLQIGPVLCNYDEPICWECFETREAHFEVDPEEYRRRNRHFHRSKGIVGIYPRRAPMIFACRLVQMLAQMCRREIHSGYVWRFDLLTREIDEARVLGLQGCPNCDTTRPLGKHLISIKEQLAYLSGQIPSVTSSSDSEGS